MPACRDVPEPLVPMTVRRRQVRSGAGQRPGFGRRGFRQPVGGVVEPGGLVDRSSRRRGQSLVVVGAPLGAPLAGLPSHPARHPVSRHPAGSMPGRLAGAGVTLGRPEAVLLGAACVPRRTDSDDSGRSGPPGGRGSRFVGPYASGDGQHRHCQLAGRAAGAPAGVATVPCCGSAAVAATWGDRVGAGSTSPNPR